MSNLTKRVDCLEKGHKWVFVEYQLTWPRCQITETCSRCGKTVARRGSRKETRACKQLKSLPCKSEIDVTY